MATGGNEDRCRRQPKSRPSDRSRPCSPPPSPIRRTSRASLILARQRETAQADVAEAADLGRALETLPQASGSISRTLATTGHSFCSAELYQEACQPPPCYCGAMTDDDVNGIADWIIRRGLEGVDGPSCCASSASAATRPACRSRARCHRRHAASGPRRPRLPLARRRPSEETASTTMAARRGRGGRDWQRSPFYHLLQPGATELRRRIGRATSSGFDASRDETRARPTTSPSSTASPRRRDRRDGLRLFQWSTRRRDGFSDAEPAALRRLVPVAGAGAQVRVAGRIAGTLVEVYLGRDAGQRVLRGPHRARRRRPHRRGAVVLRPARLTPRSATRRRPTRSSRCSTTMPRR